MFTDFAYEDYEKRRDGRGDTREYRMGREGELRLLEWRIESEEQQRRYRRPMGIYVTMFCRPIWQMSEQEFESAAEAVAHELLRLLSPMLGSETSEKTILVAGLGNPSFTVDAIGPKTAERVSVNRHLFSGERTFSLAAIIPGVPAGTGIETVEQLSGIVSAVAPDALLVVDALAAKNYRRIGSTVQLGNSGISPGSGVGNEGKAINYRTLGVPVIALGVPTVVDSAYLIEDALSRGGMTDLSARMQEVLQDSRGYFVCPKESDLITDAVSSLLARAIDLLCVGKA